jgi:hypothetical protein
MNRYQKGVIVVTVASVVGVWGSSGSAQAQPVHTSMSDTITSSTSTYNSISELVNADHSVTDTWTDGSTVVKVSGARGTLVQATSQMAKSGSTTMVTAEVSATAPAVVKTAAAANAAISAYALEGRSVVDDAVATGMDRATAQRLFGHLMDAPTSLVTVAPAVRPATSSTPTAHAATNMPRPSVLGAPTVALASGSIYDSWCVSLSQDGNRVHSSGCDVQRLDQQRGGDWYLGDEFQDSGVSTDTCSLCAGQDRLTQLWSDLAYPSNNTIVNHNPAGSASEPSSCRSVMVGVTSPETGLQYTETQSLCSSNFGPHSLRTGPSSPVFGVVWNGTEPHANWWEATEGVDVVHDPAGASPSASLTISQTYNY